jgi:hypothetical protein
MFLWPQFVTYVSIIKTSDLMYVSLKVKYYILSTVTKIGMCR